MASPEAEAIDRQTEAIDRLTEAIRETSADNYDRLQELVDCMANMCRHLEWGINKQFGTDPHPGV
jgi:hypothetical protein